jgi:ABC-type microcin C transport system duplicated ATPase subunit YejF
MAAIPLLELENVRTWFYTREGVVRAVDGVSFEIAAGETLAVVGESGCGKSVTAQSILRLLPSPPARIVEGAIRFEGRNLLELDDGAMRDIRGNQIAMIFQEPMTSLNPVLNIGHQIAESLVRHQALSRRDADARAVDMLKLVNISEPERRAKRIPAPALGRHAPARDDRDGARLQSEAPDRRRADHCARRHDPGADPRPDARPEDRWVPPSCSSPTTSASWPRWPNAWS